MQRWQKLLACFTVWGFVLVYRIAVAIALPPQEIADIARGSTVRLVIKDTYSSQLRFGRGFIVGTDQIVTNYHVIKNMSSGYVRLVEKEKRYAVGQILAYDEDRDLAVVKAPGIDAPALPLGDSDTVRITDTIYVAANPQGSKDTVASGNISAILPPGAYLTTVRPSSGDPWDWYAPCKLLQMTALNFKGSTGAPVLNDKGEVIGIVFAGLSLLQPDLTDLTIPKNLNFAIAVNHLKPLLTMPSSSTPVKPQVNSPKTESSKPVKPQVNSSKTDLPQPASPRYTLEKGIELYEQAKYDEAGNALSSVVQELTDPERKAQAYLYLGCAEWGAGESKEKVREQFQNAIRHNPNQKLSPRIGEDHPIFGELLEEVRKELTGELTVISLLPQTKIWIDGNKIDRKRLGTGIASRRLLKGNYIVEGIYDRESEKKAIRIEPNQHTELVLAIPPAMKHKPHPKISVAAIIPLTVSLTSSKAPRQVEIYYKVYDKDSNELAQNSQKMRLWEKQSTSSTWIYKVGLPSQKHVGLIEYYIRVEYGNDLKFKLPDHQSRYYRTSIVDDKPPTIYLLDPSDGAEFTLNRQIAIRAEVKDNGSVKAVHIHFSPSNTQKLAEEDSSGIYTTDITVSKTGSLQYYLIAIDEAGNENKSELRRLEIKAEADEGENESTSEPRHPETTTLIDDEDNEITLEATLPETATPIDEQENESQPKLEPKKIAAEQKPQEKESPEKPPDTPFSMPPKKPPTASQRIWASYTWLGGFSAIPSAFDLINNSMFRLTYLREGQTHPTLGARLDFYPDRRYASVTALWGPALGDSNIAFTLRGGIAAYKHTSTTTPLEEAIHITPIVGTGLKVQPVDKIAIDATGSIQSRQGISLYHYEAGIRFYITRELSLRAGYGRLHLGNVSVTSFQMGLGVNF